MRLPGNNWITACLLKGRCRMRILDLVDSSTVAISQDLRYRYPWLKNLQTATFEPMHLPNLTPTLTACNHNWSISLGALILDIKLRNRKFSSPEAFSIRQIQVCGPANFRSSDPRGPKAVPLTINSTHFSIKTFPALLVSYPKSPLQYRHYE